MIEMCETDCCGQCSEKQTFSNLLSNTWDFQCQITMNIQVYRYIHFEILTLGKITV